MLDLLAKILTVAGVLWVLGYIYYAFFQTVAERIAYDLRSRYLKAIL